MLGVDPQIEQHLLDLRGVSVNDSEIFGERQVDPDHLGECSTKQFFHPADLAIQGYRAELGFALSAEGEDPRDEVRAVSCSMLNGFQFLEDIKNTF